jgi:hypothetical protein
MYLSKRDQNSGMRTLERRIRRKLHDEITTKSIKELRDEYL